jgi:hypothetical protein
VSYRRTAPMPGGRRDKRHQDAARNRLTRQLGVTFAVVAFAAGSFASAAADTISGTAKQAQATTDELVTKVAAEAIDVTVETVTEEQVIKPGEVVKKDPTAFKGEKTVLTKGEAGTELVTYNVTYENGVEVSRELALSVVTEPATDKVISVGTLVIPKTTSAQQGTNRGIGQHMALAIYGWEGAQWACLSELWNRESGWRHTAGNPTTGAYGIPQALPGDKMAKYGADWRTNPATQIEWGLAYIKGRYGNPCNAWSHFLNKNWY